ncbi:ATP-grasp domain-containing protein [Salinicoccus roseus]|uniref:ATP-binding protein n=1 Tax=Salinicoccus roseus TaxID=45670 RepID=UPI0023009E8A|nr:ATP-grasp domain-containing protein [Salinicoccus roseus]
MSNSDVRYLPQLKDALPEHAHGYMSSGYSIALEGWRRGLELKIKVNYFRRESKVVEYVLSNKKRTHYFQTTRGDLVSKEAVKICINKNLTKKYLVEAGVKTPQGEVFNRNDNDDEVAAYAEQLGYPVVLKPTDGTGGAGVIADIKNDEEMQQALQYVRGQLENENVIVEKHFQGEDHRLYVVGDEVVGVFKRDPASVKGNGKDTIQQLLKYKNEERMKIPSLANKPIKTNSETKELLTRLGYTMKSVPNEGEVVFLKSKNNVSSGGEAVDVTDETTEEMKKIAVNATKAIPTLIQGGVDMMIDKENNEGVVLEVNSRAHIRTHLFPSYGQARDIPSAIIDYYFPETKNYNHVEAAKLYFDFDHVYESFVKGNSNYIEIPRIPKNIEVTRFMLISDEFPRDFIDWIQTTARKNRVSGSAKIISENEIDLVLGGGAEDIKLFESILENKVRRSNKSIDITRGIEVFPVMQGFNIQGSLEQCKGDSIDVLRKENKKLKSEILELKKGYHNIPIAQYMKIKRKMKYLKKFILKS